MKRSKDKESKKPVNTKYHSGFVSGLEMLLWPYRDQIAIEPEKWLSTEGIRMDVLILKKDPSLVLGFDICRIFKGHNILEYKRPDDKLNIDVFAKVMSYVNLYKSQGYPVDAVSYDDISATIYRHAYPRDAFQQLKEYGAVIEEKYPGVYYITGMSPFPIQVLVGRQLDSKEYAMFRVLVHGASDDDIRNFKEMAMGNEDAAYQKNADNIFQVSISANRESYARLCREESEMSKAMQEFLEELFKDDLIKADQAGEARGEARGEIRGTIKVYHDELKLSPADIIKKIMIRFSLDEKTAANYVTETLGLQLV